MAKDRSRSTGGRDENVPAEIQRFMSDVIRNSLIRFDVLRFFYQNPYAILTISDLSVWVSREERPLAEALQQLAAAGYLAQSRASAAFIITPDREKRREIEKFFDYLEENPDEARKLRVQLRRRMEAK